MANQVTVDFDKVTKAAQALKANPPKAADIIKDPKAFLAAQGVQIDGNIEAMIKNKGQLAVAKAPKQAAAVHIDV
jgi:uncharacterized protein YhbP (UPF0306 family)